MSDGITSAMARYEGLEFNNGVAIPQKPAQAILLADFLVSHGMSFGHTVQTAIGAIMKGMELGKPPTWALQNIAIIRGKPAIWGAGLKGLGMEHPECRNRFLSGCYSGPEIASIIGRKASTSPETDMEVMRAELAGELAVRFQALSEKQRQQPGYFCGWAVAMRGETVAVSLFDSLDADTAGLGGKGSMYEKWPRRMLSARAIGFLIRDLFPESMVTDMTREEAEDEERVSVRQVSPTVRSTADLVEPTPVEAEPIETEYQEVHAPPQPEPRSSEDEASLRQRLKVAMAKMTEAGVDAKTTVAGMSGGRSWRDLTLHEQRQVVDAAEAFKK